MKISERFVLFREEGILKLKDTQRPKFKAIYVDFGDYYKLWMRERASIKKSILARAIGYRGQSLSILDGTLGFAKDAFLFCLLGCQVLAVEKSEIIFALVQDAIGRANRNPKIKEIVDKLKILNVDLRSLVAPKFDVIYLDPMYSLTKTSAAPQARMQILRDLLSASGDTEELLDFALTRANFRVVLKRAPKAPVLKGDLIHSYLSKAVRYDVYKPRSGLGLTNSSRYCQS